MRPHEVSPGALYGRAGQADAVAKPAGDVEHLDADLTRAHGSARGRRRKDDSLQEVQNLPDQQTFLDHFIEREGPMRWASVSLGRTRSRTRSARTAVVVGTGLLLLASSGCDSTEDTTNAEEPLRYCGIVDRKVVEAAVGDVELTTHDDDALDRRSRMYNGIDCRLSSGSGSPLVTITTADYADESARNDMEARLRAEGRADDACAVLQEGRVGKSCQDVDDSGETNVGIGYDDRWIRVLARHRDGDTPPAVDDVVAIANDIDKFLTEHDKQ